MEQIKELGRISAARFGYGGYQEAMIGLSLSFEGTGWGVQDFKGAWATKRSDSAKWTEEDRIRELGETVMSLNDILSKAKKHHVGQLVGTPVEMTFIGGKLHDWRVLEEVL